MTNKDALPGYPMIMSVDDSKLFLNLCKLYQIYHSIDMLVVEEDDYANPTVYLQNNKEACVFHWLEFALFELTEFVNILYIEAESTYHIELDKATIINNFDLETYYDSITNWSSYFEGEDLSLLDEKNIINCYKAYRCMEEYKNAENEFPSKIPEDLEELLDNIESYYKKHIEKNEKEEKETNNEKEETNGEDDDDGEIEKETIPLTSGVPDLRHLEDDDDRNVNMFHIEDEYEDDDDDQMTKINLIKHNLVEDGIYKY